VERARQDLNLPCGALGWHPGNAPPAYDRSVNEDTSAIHEHESEAIRALGHRDFVGGTWEEVGRHELQFLVDQGLRPHHCLLDIGCGALRGGVHFIAYLQRGRYLGIDKHESLIRAGLDQELDPGLRAEREPEIVVSPAFDFSRLSKRPHYACAFSLFTHITDDDIRLCLRRLIEFARPGCRFFATYFEAREPVENPAASDSTRRFDYTAEQLLETGRAEGWRARRIGNWGPGRRQLMMLFEAPAPVSAPDGRRPAD
jgi:hypothetical protein